MTWWVDEAIKAAPGAVGALFSTRWMVGTKTEKLVMLGAGRGELGDVPLWDLAPTIAKWMGIRWALEPDGKPIKVLP